MVAPVIATKSNNTADGTSITLTAPTGIADGDVLLIVLGLDGDPDTFVNPSGFVQISPTDGDHNVAFCTFYVIYKIASGESGNYTVSWVSNEKVQGLMYRITGAISGDEVQDPNNLNSGAVAAATALSYSTDTDDTLALALYGMDRNRITEGQADDGVGWTTEDILEEGSAGGAVAGVSRKTIGTAGATLDGVQTQSTSDQWLTRQIGIRSIAPAAGDNIQSQAIIIG